MPFCAIVTLQSSKTDVPETDGVLLFLKIVESFSGCYCPIIFEWSVWVQRCVSLVDDSSGVCVWVGGCVYGYVWRRGWQKNMFCRGIEF